MEMQSQKRTTTPTITQEQYHQLIGLLLLGKQYTRMLDELTRAALQITNEVDSSGQREQYGHTADAICCEYSVDRLLDLLGIEVEKSEGLKRENQPLARPA